MIHFVVHEEGDGVGVVVVEGVKAGQSLSGWIMEDDKDIEISAKTPTFSGTPRRRLRRTRTETSGSVSARTADLSATVTGRSCVWDHPR